jgi:peptidase M1-like protein
MNTVFSPRRLLLIALAAVLTLLAGCGVAGIGGPSGPSVDPGAYAGTLWAQRPSIELSYDVAPDLSSVTGRETGTFTPDLRTCELVFRAWPNQPSMAKVGDSLTVTDTLVNGKPVTARTEPAGAPADAPPTLIRLPVDGCLNPGQSVHFELGFQVRLGRDADERVGYSPKTQTAWFGTAFPLLSWVRGIGWTQDPAVNMNGESVVSEDFQVRLAVTAPAELQVQGVGAPAGDVPGPRPGTTTHQFSADAVRDVAVGVGRYDVRTEDLGGLRLHLATPSSGVKSDPSAWVNQLRDSVTGLSALFGPFPYRDLWITITPGQSDGTEFPDAIQFGDTKSKDLASLVAHEVSHQWFYSLVGNNQNEHPWLDESLATLGEALVGGDGDYYRSYDVPNRVVGKMGEPMSYWAEHGGFDRYTAGVYNQGAATLLKARTEVGADAFDADLRSYVKANAHRVATPDDFARAFANQPPVLTALRAAGAISASG